jgi:hypothetical protein
VLCIINKEEEEEVWQRGVATWYHWHRACNMSRAGCHNGLTAMTKQSELYDRMSPMASFRSAQCLCNGLDDRGSIPGRGWEFFSSPPRPDRFWGSPSLLSNWYRDLTSGVKRPGREADHSSPSSAKVKNAWSYTSIPPCVFMAW